MVTVVHTVLENEKKEGFEKLCKTIKIRKELTNTLQTNVVHIQDVICLIEADGILYMDFSIHLKIKMMAKYGS